MKLYFRKSYISIHSEKIILFWEKCSGHRNIRAMVPFPYIIIFRNTEQENLAWVVNHERIHFRQQLELLYVGGILLAFFEKLYARFVLKKNRMERYTFTAVEQEAYLNQNNPAYLSTRPFGRVFWHIAHKKHFIPDSSKPGELLFPNNGLS